MAADTSSLPAALLYKPIDRVTRSTLVLHVSVMPVPGWEAAESSVHIAPGDPQPWGVLLESLPVPLRCSPAPVPFQDLLKHTPADHPDYPLLQDALRISQNFLSSINEDIDPRRTAVTTPKGEVSQRGGQYLVTG